MAKQNISLTADNVIFCETNDVVKILLVQRKYDPFKGSWALPGGFLKNDEPLEEGAKRELEEETGLNVKNLWQIRSYGAPDRDPRGRTVSVAFWGEIPSEEKVKGSDDAEKADWFNIDKLPKLAFDHREIVEDAIKKYESDKGLNK